MQKGIFEDDVMPILSGCYSDARDKASARYRAAIPLRINHRFLSLFVDFGGTSSFAFVLSKLVQAFAAIQQYFFTSEQTGHLWCFWGILHLTWRARTHNMPLPVF